VRSFFLSLRSARPAVPVQSGVPLSGRVTLWWSERLVSGVRFFAPPTASGVGVTRHPQMGAAEQLLVNVR
jgi:hypothetical protein